MSWDPITREQLVNTRASLLLRASPLGVRRWNPDASPAAPGHERDGLKDSSSPVSAPVEAPYCDVCRTLPEQYWCGAH